jgi:hypothetical protein
MHRIIPSIQLCPLMVARRFVTASTFAGYIGLCKSVSALKPALQSEGCLTILTFSLMVWAKVSLAVSRVSDGGEMGISHQGFVSGYPLITQAR